MKLKALRRHHLQRLKYKRKYDRNYHSHLTNATTGVTSQITPIHQHIITPARCSCWMCGNPRKFYGNSKHTKTIQERRADNDSNYWQANWRGVG